MKKYYQKGVTLIELLVVIAIIGVLAGTIVAAINPVVQLQKGRDAKRKGDLQQIRAALEQYRADKGGYWFWAQHYLATCNASFTDGASNTYIQKFPCDPNGSSYYNGGNYDYEGTTGNSYAIIACLENTNDPDGILSSNAQFPPSAISSNCPSNRFYVLTNP